MTGKVCCLMLNMKIEHADFSFFKNKTTPITMPNTHKTAAAMAIYMPIDDDDDAEVLSSGVK